MSTEVLVGRSSRPEKINVRPVTAAEARDLRPGDVLYFTDHQRAVDGLRVDRVRVNGAVKTWKRSPSRLEVPWKYGYKGPYGRFTEDDFTQGRVLRQVN